MATNTVVAKAKPVAVEVAEPEVVDDLEFFQSCVVSMVEPAYNRATSDGVAKEDNRKWNESILSQLLAVLNVGKVVSELYETIKDTLASKVATLGTVNGLGADELSTLKGIIDNSVSRLNGPFYDICRIVESEGSKNLIIEGTKDDATWSGLVQYADKRQKIVIFDPEQWEDGTRLVHFKVKGIERSITVEKAQASRKEWVKAVAHAKALKGASIQSWTAVETQYRLNHPAGMRDARRKEDAVAISTVVLSGVDARASATLFASLSKKDKDALRAEHQQK